MSIPAGIDGNAPVRARHQIDIDASLDTVWRLHADVNNWTAWQTDITAARLDGAFQPGASFEWTSHGLTVVSTIYAAADHARVLWGGTASGITGVHEWLFGQTRAGAHVTTQESFAGQPVEADTASIQAILDTSLAVWLKKLKAAAEDAA
jgi:hypothetical protein